MPKFPKTFGRRKSTPNPLEELENTPVTGTFRVFERTDNGSKSFDGGIKAARASAALTSSPASKDENMFEDLKGSRGSAASNTNTVSTMDNSSRFSAASTTPSSTDIANQEEWRSPHDKPLKDLPPLPKSTTGFSLKAAAHTFSFGRGKPSTPSPSRVLDGFPSPDLAPRRNDDSQRQRAVTASSYASTATPPKLDERELGLSLGGDFAEMFAGFGERKSIILEAETDRAMSETPDFSSPSAASRPLITNRSNQPSPLNIDRSREVDAAPHSWTSHNSTDRLMSNASPLYTLNDSRPSIPRYDSPPIRKEVGSTARPQRPGGVADSGVKRRSAFAVRRQSTLEFGDAIDEDAKLLRESLNAARHLTPEVSLPSKPRDSWIQPLTKDLPPVQPATPVSQKVESHGTTLAKTIKPIPQEDNMFDEQILAAASVADQYSQTPRSPPKHRVMTPAQFEMYRRQHEGSSPIGRPSNDDENEEDTYDDEEDEAEKQRQLAKQRRKQEAHMSVYRQQMMKVTGESTVSRPGLMLSQSSPNLLTLPSGMDDGDDEDEEIPLAILAAHGFPNKNRPPTQLSSMNSNPNLRAASQMGAYPPPPQSVAGDSVSGSGGRLPVFARNLPQDPYIGAGLVRPSNRESLTFGTGAGSVHGGGPRGAPPGGLVNVIAREEISRAMRRGSPNNAGEYGAPPSNGFNGLGSPANVQMPYGMNGMGQMTPGDQAQFEMAQQMQQFMQMQMQFMQMMTAGQGPSPPPNGPSMTRASTLINMQPAPIPTNQHQRAMTSLDPNAAPWVKQKQRNSMFPMQSGSYTPSIAPSERSNVGMPGRYRPVSHYQADNSRTTTMSGALQDWSENKLPPTTIKAVKKGESASDEDDEVGWEAMKQRREKKRSMWRSKKDPKGLEELANWTT